MGVGRGGGCQQRASSLAGAIKTLPFLLLCSLSEEAALLYLKEKKTFSSFASLSKTKETLVVQWQTLSFQFSAASRKYSPPPSPFPISQLFFLHKYSHHNRILPSPPSPHASNALRRRRKSVRARFPKNEIPPHLVRTRFLLLRDN